MTQKGTRILKVKKGSAAAKAGLTPGDRILTVNGHEIDDELALRFYLSEERLKLCVLQSNGCKRQVVLKLPEGRRSGPADRGIQDADLQQRLPVLLCGSTPPGRPAGPAGQGR